MSDDSTKTVRADPREEPLPDATSDPDRSVGRRLQANLIWAGTGRLLSVCFLFLIHSWLTRHLTKEDYGRFVLIESITLLLSILVLGGLPAVSLRMLRGYLVGGDVAGASRVVRASLLIMVGTSLLASVAVTAISCLGQGQILNGVLWQWFPWILAWATCSAFLRMVSELARGFEMLGFSYLVGGQSGGFGVNAFVLLCIVVASLLSPLSLLMVLGLQIAVQLFCTIPAIIVLLKLTTHEQTAADSSAMSLSLRRVLASSTPLLIQQIVAFGIPEVDTILLGSFASTDETALYGASKKLVFLAVVPLLLVNHAIQPFVAELHAKRDFARLTAIVRGTATIAALPGLLLVLALILIPDTILSLCFGPDYAAAAISTRILAAGAAAFLVTGSCGLVQTMTGHERSAMWTSLIAGAMYLCAAPLLISKFGILGAAAGTTSLQFLTRFSSLFMVYYHEKIWTSITVSGTVISQCLSLLLAGRSRANK
jgi:O-antigen/teichoic acid export membrane protein